MATHSLLRFFWVVSLHHQQILPFFESPHLRRWNRRIVSSFTARLGHGLARVRAAGPRAKSRERMSAGDDEFDISDTPERRALKVRLSEMREEHRALDSAILALQEQSTGDALQLARLKKRKLVLRDQIQWIEDRLMPDIIA